MRHGEPPASVRRLLDRVRRRLEVAGAGRIAPARLVHQLPGRRGDRAAQVLLSFDDGPAPDTTPLLLEVLAAEQVQAAFFMCGANAARHPDLVRDVAAAGHTIGGHTWDHAPLHQLDAAAWRRQIDDTHALLADLTGVTVRYVRAPYGVLDRDARRRLRRADLVPVGASTTGRDWVETSPAAIAARVAARLEPGAIVLLHDACGDLLRPGGRLPAGVHADRRPTVAAVPDIVAAVRDAGLTPTGLGTRDAAGRHD